MKQLTDTEIKRLLLDILKEIDSFCRSNNLTYFLAYGTLLGAVRHKGFIPWDDDIDICMPRSDYEKFISSFAGEDQRYQVVSHTKDKKYPFFFAKVQDTGTILETKWNFTYKLGLYVDIFPIDAVPEEKNLQRKYMNLFHFYRNIYNIKVIRFRPGRSILKNMLLLAGKPIASLFPFSFLTTKIDAMSRRYHFSDHELVSISATTDKRMILEKALFSEGRKMQFENMEANVAIGYAAILEKNYGDYMKLPPVEKQISTHEYKAFMTI